MTKLFINASRDKNGNTAKIARSLLDTNYSTINLINYYLHQMGQHDHDDFSKIYNHAKSSNVIVFGTPVYFGDMSGSLKTLIDRMNEMSWDNSPFKNKDLYLIVSYATTPKSVGTITNSVKMLANAIHMRFKGVITNVDKAKRTDIE